MKKAAAFSVIHGAIAILSLGSLAYGQRPIPCKYFPLVGKASIEPSGGLISLQIRSDPAQFQRGEQAEYAAKCQLSLYTPAPWLTVVEQTPLDDKGSSTVTLRANPNDVAVARVATLTVGTPRTVYPGAGPDPANTIVTIEQKSATHPDQAAPIVNQLGIVSNASSLFPVAPGSLISIYGSNLATGTATFAVPLPYGSNGTSVLANGNPCPLLYVSPTLINAQLPVDTPTGTITITVNVNGMTGSNTTTVVPAAPGIFMFGGGTEAIVQHTDGSNVTTSSPAAAGEGVAFYGTGIGPLSPALATDQTAGGEGDLSTATSSCVVQVNGVSAHVGYCGMTPGLVGLAQVNFNMPANVGTGTSTLIWVVNGLPSQQTTFATSGPGPSPDACPVITNFSVSPTSISAGQTATLSWSVSNATLENPISITGIGSVAPSGFDALLSPSATTTYTIRVQSSTCATVSASVTLTVTTQAAAPVVNSFTVSPTSIAAGSDASLSWSVSNSSSVSINNGIGSVGSSGNLSVSPSSTTTYTITALNSAGASVSSSVTLTVTAPLGNVTLVFTNDLINGATISVNGTAVGTASAGQTQQITVASTPSMTISFVVNPTLTNTGVAVGDPFSGTFPVQNAPTGTLNFTISNYFANSNTYYFAPLITNSSGTDLEMAVNYGLSAQNECNCVAYNGETAVNIGYYLYYSNSNVYGFGNGANYTGAYEYFNDVTGVAANSGVVNLTFSSAFP